MIDKAHIDQWADMQSAKGDFPQLIRRLVFTTVTPHLIKCNIPFGSAVFMGGWDGEVEALKQTEFIPEGKTILEFGTSRNYKDKAEKDYVKRSSEDYKGLNKADTTYIFMTPRVWGDKKNWEDEKNGEGVWKEVRVYDSTVLAQWIISTPPVELWFESLMGLPTPNMVMGNERLEELLIGGSVTLLPSFYTVGREDVAMEMMSMLGSPTLRAYRAASKEEAIGFILAAGKLFPEKEQEEFYSKTIVIEDKNAFRQMRTQTSLINLVPDFEDATVLHRAVSQGKIVLVPLGPGDDFNQYAVDLPAPNRLQLEQTLIASGVEEETALRVVRDCSCNLTMIKKQLGFPIIRVEWMNDEHIAELVPALILERWNDNFDGDKEVVASLSGKAYSDYMSSMIVWSQKPVPPVMNVGTFWRITSPLSLWSDLSRLVTKEQLDMLVELSVKVLTGDEKRYSYQLRYGLLNTLIILAWHGDQLFSAGISFQYRVDSIIKKVIQNADDTRWNDIAKFLPLVAEASPTEFIHEVKASLSRDNSPIMSLFIEEEGTFAAEGNYPYLLWALESLAWLPDNLMEVSEILLTLSEKDPGGKLANRPFSSLVDIYLPWLPHTTAFIDDRLSVLQALAQKGYAKIWDLLLALLPKLHGFTSGTHQMKWRGYDLNIPTGATEPDIWKTIEFLCVELKVLYGGGDHQMAGLIDKIEPIPHTVRSKLIAWIKDTLKECDHPMPETRKELRETLWYQNNLKEESSGRLTKLEMEDIREAYEAVTPANIVEKNKWLFDEYSPRFPELVKDKTDSFARMKLLDEVREEAVSEWIQNLPLEEVVFIRKQVVEPSEFGRSLGHFYATEGLEALVLPLFASAEDEKFVGGYIRGMEREKGAEKMIEYVDSKMPSLTEQSLVTLLHYLSYPSEKLFSYIETLPSEIQEKYWLRYQGMTCGGMDDVSAYALNKLVSVGRSLDALNGSWHLVKDMSTEMLQTILDGALKCSTELNGAVNGMAFECFMEELHKRDDADNELLLTLEWLLLPLLKHSSSKDVIVLLYEKMQSEPDFFVQLLTFLYKPESGGEETETGDDTLVKQQNAIRAFYLFREWKLIPGVDESGQVDGKALREWIKQALELAKNEDREKYVYTQLGGLFARYPERKDNPNWPPYDIFAVMEELNSEALFRNYNVGMYNKRGFTSRGCYDGGNIERRNAEYFADLKKKCQPLYPHVAKVFEDLERQYTQMAKDMDDEATIAQLDY